MSKRLRLAIVAGGGLLTICFLTAALLANREPTYQGLTISQWLSSRDSTQKDEALLILGTNNLPLLARRLAYDRENDLLRSTVDRLPTKIRDCAPLATLASRRTVLAHEAADLLRKLRTNAVPAIPQLAAIAHREGYRADTALSVLSFLGDEGLAIVASEGTHTDAKARYYVVVLLSQHTESRVARSALTNALADPDPTVRKAAWHSITNRLP